jgi:tetratricopeptide (TPR) repeat protein
LLAAAGGLRAEEKVVVKTVRYVMGEQDSRQAVRERAVREAKRQVLEEAGVFVQAESTLKEVTRETRTEYSDETELKSDVQQLTAGVTRTRVLKEDWKNENGAFVLYATCEVAVDVTDMEARIRELIARRRKLDTLSPLENEMARLKLELEMIKARSEAGATGGVPDSVGAGTVSPVTPTPEAMLLGARRLFERGLYENAAKEVERVIKDAGPSAPAHVLLGECFAQKKGWYRLAVREVEKALKLEPKSIQAKLSLANIHLRVGRNEREARELLEDVLLADPDNRDAGRMLESLEKKRSSGLSFGW